MAAEPGAEPTPETTEAASTPAPDDSGLTAVLDAIRDSYYPGTAGCSLTAAAMAGQMMDWYLQNGGADREALNITEPGEDSSGMAFGDKLEDIYTTAVGLYGFYGKALMDTCGYSPRQWPIRCRMWIGCSPWSMRPWT